MANSLTRLRIENFQKHELLDIRLEQINVFVGSSDVGKSAILRAIRWLSTNKPGGADFVRYGSEECEVRLRVGRDTIYRQRGKENLYRLGQQEFKAFGANVPDAVAKILNVDALINFQDQHDAAFWFADSPGEVGRRLNAIVDLEMIDRVMSDAASRTRQTKSEHDVVDRQLQQAKQELEALHYVPEMQRDYAEIADGQKRIDELTEGIAYLKDLLADIQQKQAVLDSLRQPVRDFRALVESQQTITELGQQCKQLKQLLKQIDEAQQLASRPLPNLTRLSNLFNQVEQLRKDTIRLRKVLAELDTQDLRVYELREELTDAENELENWQEELCPTCGRPLK